MIDKYLKIGDFAEACGVKKATLIHYAKIGLLKPALIGENGYSYYAPEQIYDFELINVLKCMNVPLSEIKDYIETKNGDLPACREILQKKLEELQKYREYLHSVEVLVRNTLRDMDSVNDEKLDVIEEVVFDKPELYYVYKMPHRTADSTYMLHNSRDIIKHIQDSFLNESINVVEVVMQDDILNETYRKSLGGFLAKTDAVMEKNNLFMRPAGTYLTIADRKGGDEIPSLYHKLKKYAEANGYTVCGNGYGKDLLSHIVERDRSKYLFRCYIQVKKQEN
ncbi:MAG: MerR family transcriptional regulator [bacterium]|nr:MerR family transcriptional regulator [bacterium]